MGGVLPVLWELLAVDEEGIDYTTEPIMLPELWRTLKVPQALLEDFQFTLDRVFIVSCADANKGYSCCFSSE
jgi:hypothetical protein